MSYLLFSKLFCNSAWAPSSSHHSQMIQEGAQNQPLRKKAFNLISLNPISPSPREHPSCLSRERGRVNCPQQSLSDRAPPVPGHQDCLCCYCSLWAQGTAFSGGSSATAWHCTLPTKQFLGCEQLKLTFSCFCCFVSFSFSFFCFFFAVTFPPTSSPFLFLIEKNKRKPQIHERKLLKWLSSSYQSSDYWLPVSAEAWISSILAGKSIFQILQCCFIDLNLALQCELPQSGQVYLRGFPRGNHVVWENSMWKTAAFSGIFIHIHLIYSSVHQRHT